jgi:hypothetical protein
MFSLPVDDAESARQCIAFSSEGSKNCSDDAKTMVHEKMLPHAGLDCILAAYITSCYSDSRESNVALRSVDKHSDTQCKHPAHKPVLRSVLNIAYLAAVQTVHYSRSFLPRTRIDQSAVLEHASYLQRYRTQS